MNNAKFCTTAQVCSSVYFTIYIIHKIYTTQHIQRHKIIVIAIHTTRTLVLGYDDVVIFQPQFIEYTTYLLCSFEWNAINGIPQQESLEIIECRVCCNGHLTHAVSKRLRYSSIKYSYRATYLTCCTIVDQARAFAPQSLEIILCNARFCSVSCLLLFSAFFCMASLSCNVFVNFAFST